MNYLLDVNVLLALLLQQHPQHPRVGGWYNGLTRDDRVLLCPHGEMGFVRIASGQYLTDILESQMLLKHFAMHTNVRRIADNQFADSLPVWVKTWKQVSDGHLQALATAHHALLATLDKGIPLAFLLPE